MAVSLKTDLRFPIPGQQGRGDRIIHSARTIRNIELEINPPCLENALRLAAYLDVPVESLFKLDDTYQSQSI